MGRGNKGRISRRDFIGSTLIGSGAALLAAGAPGLMREARAQTIAAPLRGLGPEWTGYGGVGDYAPSPGNTWQVVNAAHGVRMGAYDKAIAEAEDTGETVDLAVVGCGFAGCAAAFYYKLERSGDSVLMFDNHALFGGEAKQNEFDVDGYRLWGPQGSNGNPWPPHRAKESGFWGPLWEQLGMPMELQWQEATGLARDIRIPKDVYSPMHVGWELADLGWYTEAGGMARNPWANRFDGVPLPEQLKQDLIWMETFRQPPRRDDWAEWLDSMTYQDFLTKVMGIKSDVAGYLNPQTAAMGCGLGADVISAYSAHAFLQPGVNAYLRYAGIGDPSDYIELASFPGGNTGTLRRIVKRLIPAAIEGEDNTRDVVFGRIRFDQLDQPRHAVRMRLSSLVVDVRHDGSPESAKQLFVTYLKDGRLYRVRARRVIMSGQQHLNKRIIRDLPPDLHAAMDSFHHAPMLVINVALRNWKFLEKLGVAAVRWFEGFGWFFSMRRQMLFDGEAPMPLDPSKPTVLTMYNPFCIPGLPVDKQTVAARMQMFGLRFADIEKGVTDQFTKMFAGAGFNAERDIAAIVANRWGHAYVVSPPGFYFGRDGQPAASDVIRRGFGRIHFAHSELSGMQMWETATHEGERAAAQAVQI